MIAHRCMCPHFHHMIQGKRRLNCLSSSLLIPIDFDSLSFDCLRYVRWEKTSRPWRHAEKEKEHSIRMRI
jgi:hypothetical protein